MGEIPRESLVCIARPVSYNLFVRRGNPTKSRNLLRFSLTARDRSVLTTAHKKWGIRSHLFLFLFRSPHFNCSLREKQKDRTFSYLNTHRYYGYSSLMCVWRDTQRQKGVQLSGPKATISEKGCTNIYFSVVSHRKKSIYFCFSVRPHHRRRKADRFIWFFGGHPRQKGVWQKKGQLLSPPPPAFATEIDLQFSTHAARWYSAVLTLWSSGTPDLSSFFSVLHCPILACSDQISIYLSYLGVGER